MKANIIKFDKNINHIKRKAAWIVKTKRMALYNHNKELIC